MSPLSRRASIGSSEGSTSNSEEASLNSGSFVMNGRVNDGVIKGVGMIAKIINDKNGIIWWLKSANHLQSVWFDARQTFVYGTNLADKNLIEIFNEGNITR